MNRYLIAIASVALLCPPLAPAFAQPRYDDRAYAPGYARDDHGCQRDQQNKQMTNAAIGAAAGGLLGNQVAGRGSRTGGTIAGVLLGAVAGYALTHDVDCNDRTYAEPTYYRGLEGQVGQRYDWRNDDDRDHGNFTPTREYRRDNYTCRDYHATTYRDDRPMRRNGSACRYEDGNWYFQ
ncbi:MAG TPA: RT0821/Lpp0805 family surface protein [Rhizomicrobium sp.]|nr:RT0821/Lpp0805 family surface protein [Rhizomicrobium sp.]